jgi:hypothetical protein
LYIKTNELFFLKKTSFLNNFNELCVRINYELGNYVSTEILTPHLWLVVLVIVLKVLKFCFIHWFEPFWFWHVGWTFIKLLRNLIKLLGRIRRRLHINLRRRAMVNLWQPYSCSTNWFQETCNSGNLATCAWEFNSTNWP